MGLRAAIFGLTCAFAIAAAPAAAEPLRREDVPEPLRPWIDWALRGNERALCPALQSGPGGSEQPERPCAWPGALELELGDAGGRFSQRWAVYADAFVPLPGDAGLFPESVQVDGAAAAVTLRGGRPVVRLAPGRHALRGELRFAALPEALATPPETGVVALRLRGEPVAAPVRDPDGRLWLRPRRQAEGEEPARLEVDVHRLVTDEVPLELATRIELRAAGRGRELLLGPALPAGFVPVSLEGPLPARLEPDGRLRVQVRPGTWTLLLAARRDRPEPELVLPAPTEAWDAEEIVAFEARPALREVELEGPPQVDPQQTGLPEAWRAFPAYVMQPGVALRFVEQRRGDAEPAADRLELERTLWLDFAGSGYTVSDRLHGELNKSWRLEMDPGVALGRAALGGADQLLTRREGSERVGLELPQGPIELEADSRIEGGGTLPAVGWDADVHGLRGTLHLPPGWRLLHAAGVDRATPTWISRWTLLDLFVVLLVTTAFLRLAGPRAGALALLALGLSYTEPGAPRYLWIAVAAGEALRRVLASGRLGRAIRAYHLVALAGLVLVALGFALGQLRGALYPSLEDARFGAAAARGELAAGMAASAPPFEADDVVSADRVELRAAVEQESLSGYAEESMKRSRASGGGRRDLYVQDPSARITTGPGLPRWQWRSVALEWNGPVERGQELDLWLLSPGWTRALAFLRVGLLAALVLFLLRAATRAGRGPGPAPAAAAIGAAVAFVCLTTAAPARADFPSPEMLEDLRARLLETPACAPACAALPLLRLDATPERLELVLRVDAAARTALPLPVPLRGWVPERATLDGAPAELRREGAYLWLALEPGGHELRLSGALAGRDVELPLPLRPHRVELQAQGWRVTGLTPDGVASESLRLERLGSAGTEPATGDRLTPGALPPFARVVRELRLGLKWEATTRVVRVSPDDATLSLAIPLLPGESVTSAHVRVEDGRAVVGLPPGQQGTSFESILDPREALALEAGEPGPFAVTWVVEASPVWHLEADGIAPIHDPSPARRLRTWRPWPGERVTLAVTRPEGVAGATVTIDASELALEPGLRAADATLALHLRSSQGGQHRVVLPEGAELEGAQIDGAEQPLRQQGREVLIPLAPGARDVTLRFREPRGVTALYRTPVLDLGAPSANAELRVTPPAGRWTLLVGGPRLGPAVLFWPFLVLLAGVAFGLGRIRWTPLRAHHWALLGLGLTQVPVAAAAVVVAWLLLLGWRGRAGTRVPGRWFDALQLAVVALTAVALGTLFHSIQMGLLGVPEMQIAGNLSHAGMLRWYQDRAAAAPEGAWLLSVPLFVYRLAMLAWALWLAQAVVRWLRWGWQCFTAGETWRPLRRAAS